jgi:hypothetical protein
VAARITGKEALHYKDLLKREGGKSLMHASRKPTLTGVSIVIKKHLTILN